MKEQCVLVDQSDRRLECGYFVNTVASYVHVGIRPFNIADFVQFWEINKIQKHYLNCNESSVCTKFRHLHSKLSLAFLETIVC